MRWFVVVSSVVGCFFATCGCALGAFPGRDGLLAVQPATGLGVVLVAADGHGARRVCAAATRGDRCPVMVRPRWSPDGRSFVAGGSIVRIVYPDGSCLDCRFGAAANPAFEPDGTSISFARRLVLTADGIDSVREPGTQLPHRWVSDAVWAADGRLAVVDSARRVHTGRPRHLRVVGPGSEPSWSPDGRLLAVTARGWIVVYTLGARGSRRLVRGSAPAFSPDGRRLAYIAPGGRVMVIAADGLGPRRAVGRVRGVSVDWQPVPRHPIAGCAMPPSARVLASSADAVMAGDGPVFTRYALASVGTRSAVIGCLRATGRIRVLESIVQADEYDGEGAGDAAVAAPYGAIVRSQENLHYGDASATVVVYDLHTGARVTRLGGQEYRCGGGATFCQPTEGLHPLAISPTGVTAVDQRTIHPPGELSQSLPTIACTPNGATCEAADNQANALASNDPSGEAPAWTLAPIPGFDSRGPEFPEGMSCPTNGLCVMAAGPSSIWATSAPNSPIWGRTDLVGGPVLTGLACTAALVCVGSGRHGTLTATADPTGGATAWQTDSLPTTKDLVAPACTPGGTCAVTDGQQVFVAGNPTGGAAAWSASSTAPPYRAESCPADNFCAGIGSDGSGLFTAPGLGAPWSNSIFLNHVFFSAISCPSTALCVAVGSNGVLATSNDPNAASWTFGTIDDTRTPETLDCPTAQLCVATDQYGHVATSTNPAGGASTWTTALVDGNPCNDGHDCSEERLLYNAGDGVQVADSSMIAGDGPFLTDLAITGDVLTWTHDGNPMSATL